jgi:N-acylneuraminate cytidylyltransferase
MLTCVTVIPARAGSSLKDKNIADLGGRPLLVHAILAAKHKSVAEVIVTTDSPAYAEIADAAGAYVVMRPHELATDEAPTDPAIVHALKQWHAVSPTRPLPDVVATLQPDAPFRSATLLPTALAELEASGSDSLLCLTPLHFVWTADPWECDQAGKDERGAYSLRPRRQDMGRSLRSWHETGLLYLTRTHYLLATGARLGGRIAALEVSADEALEIDTPADLNRARALWESGWRP